MISLLLIQNMSASGIRTGPYLNPISARPQTTIIPNHQPTIPTMKTTTIPVKNTTLPIAATQPTLKVSGVYPAQTFQTSDRRPQPALISQAPVQQRILTQPQYLYPQPQYQTIPIQYVQIPSPPTMHLNFDY